MPRLFISNTAIQGDEVRLDGDAARHLGGSLRAAPGDVVRVVNEDAVELDVRVEEYASGTLTGRVTGRRPAAGEPAAHIEVIQAMAKDGMDAAIDSMVQAGVAAVRPVITERTIARPDDMRSAARVARWNNVAREAAQLAYRARIPPVHGVTTLDAALNAIPGNARVLACLISHASAPLAACDFDSRPVVLCIGPEGGFGDADCATLDAHSAEHVHLGARVMRSRLAAAIAATIVLTRANHLGVPGAQIDGPAREHV